MGEKSDSQQLTLDACFVPIGMLDTNSLSSQVAGEKAHFEGQKHALLARHGAMNPELNLLRGTACVTEGHVGMLTRRMKGRCSRLDT